MSQQRSDNGVRRTEYLVPDAACLTLHLGTVNKIVCQQMYVVIIPVQGKLYRGAVLADNVCYPYMVAFTGGAVLADNAVWCVN